METVFTYEVMGTMWKITLYEIVSSQKKEQLREQLSSILTTFDNLYSRFKEDSLVTKMSKQIGVIEVPNDFVQMMQLYKKLYEVSDKKVTPTIGTFLEDIGYDKEYSFTEKERKRPIPSFDNLLIIDDTHIEVREHMLIDIGALGKGYAVDLIRNVLTEEGYRRFLVDGSGDIFFEGSDTITVGLEHPYDFSMVIGTYTMHKGAMCSSGLTRRAWKERTHYVDPVARKSPQGISATWVVAPTCALADGLSTALFFVSLGQLEQLMKETSFEYCILNDHMEVITSPHFKATFFK